VETKLQNKNKISMRRTNKYTHPISADAPTNLVKVLVLSISKTKHPKPKIAQPLTSLIPLQTNQNKWQSIAGKQTHT
jgi:hypothetical protein